MSKEPTLADVARIAGVSAKTVSRVINQNDYVSADTLQRVQAAIAQTGYRPNRAARSLVYRQSSTIGLIIPSITNPFYPEVVSGIEHASLQRDYNVLMFNTLRDERREREAFRFLEENRVAGLIFQCPSLMSLAEIEAALKRQKAAVVLGSFPLRVPTGIVRLNIRDAMFQIVQHLLELNRTQLAYLGLQNESYAAQERLRGIKAASEHFGISVRHVLLDDTTSETDIQKGYAATRNLLQNHPEIDGLICFHDLFAFGALDACHDMGVAVPEQVAVVGFDNISFSSLKRLSLTTLHVPKFDIGLQAANLLFDLLDGRKAATEEIVLNAELIVRGSTRASS